MGRKNITDEQVVRACSMRGQPWRRLMEWTGEPEKVVYAAMARADARGLLEVGVSLRCAWLSPKGEALLRELSRKADTPTTGGPDA